MNKNRYLSDIILIKKQKDNQKKIIYKIIDLLEERNESVLFFNPNIFRHTSVLEKLQNNSKALELLEKKEKEWLKENKDGELKTENIYIYIADTLSALNETCPTCKHVKRAIKLCIELTSYKILFKNIYNGRNKEDLLELLKVLNSEECKTFKDLAVCNISEKKLNPEINNFVKNWTRSITFDLKVRVSSFINTVRNKIKKRNIRSQENLVNKYFTRENIFEDICQHMLSLSINYFLIEDFKFLSARLLNKNQIAYSKVLLKKRNIKSEEDIAEFRDRLLFLMELRNNYLSTQYIKVDALFPLGMSAGMQKLKALRDIDINTSRIIFEIFMKATLQESGDKALINLKELKEISCFYDFIYLLRPLKYIEYRLEKTALLRTKTQGSFIGYDDLKTFIKTSFMYMFLKEEEIVKKIPPNLDWNLIRNDEEIYANIFTEYIKRHKGAKIEFVELFTKVEAEFKKEKRNKTKMLKENPLIMLVNYEEMISSVIELRKKIASIES